MINNLGIVCGKKARDFIIKAMPVIAVAALASGFQQPSPPNISMVRLIANPQEYVGTLIDVSGYYRGEGSLAYLYLSKDDAFMRNSSSALPVNVEPTQAVNCNDHFVEIRGVIELLPESKLPTLVIVERILVHKMNEKTVGIYHCYTRPQNK